MVEKKVTASALVAAVVTIAVWALRTFYHFEIPAEVAAAVTTVIVAIAGYLAPHTERVAREPAPEPPAAKTPAA